MQNARHIIGAERASLFLVDGEGEKAKLKMLIADGGNLPSELPVSGLIGVSISEKNSLVCNDVYSDHRFNKEVDYLTGFKTNSVCVAPIIGINGNVIGVTEMVNKNNGFVDEDVKLLQSFSMFASVSLENSRLKESGFENVDPIEKDIMRFVGSEKNKRNTSDYLDSMKLSDDIKEKFTVLNFFSIDWKGDGHIRLLYFIFQEYGLLNEFHITNELFLKFIFKMRSTYNDVPYHNWMHACDVSQYVSYEIRTAKLSTRMTKLELFTVFIACVCHDSNHEGFNNVFNVKAETPLGILFKDQSVMETHHCEMMIQVITQIQFLATLSELEQKKVWSLAINLILATDMANHFALVKKSGALLDEGKFDFDGDEESKLLGLQLLLKVGDISNVSRPFEIADKWCDVLNNEFFRQGDLEKKTGIGLTSPLNDREHPDKPKSQIGFYNFICIPLYNVVARLFPALTVNVDSVKSNLEVWKSLIPAPKE